MQVGAAHDEIRLPIIIGLLEDINRRLCVSAILLAPVYILWINFNPNSNTAGLSYIMRFCRVFCGATLCLSILYQTRFIFATL